MGGREGERVSVNVCVREGGRVCERETEERGEREREKETEITINEHLKHPLFCASSSIFFL